VFGSIALFVLLYIGLVAYQAKVSFDCEDRNIHVDEKWVKSSGDKQQDYLISDGLSNEVFSVQDLACELPPLPQRGEDGASDDGWKVTVHYSKLM
jgi:hypothetical protein